MKNTKPTKPPRKVKTVARETSFTLRSPDARRRAAAKRRRQVEAQYRAPNGQFATVAALVDDLKLGLLISAPLPPFRSSAPLPQFRSYNWPISGR